MACHTALQPSLTTAGLPVLVLAGNPNVGKSVVFGALTGRYVTVSNYPGTTVEVTSGSARTPAGEARLVDTPGVYSLVPLSDDERVTRDILLAERPSAVLQVADAKNLARGLVITLEVAELGLPSVLCLNMADEAQGRGIYVDAAQLAARLGLPVVPTVATRGEGVTQLAAALPQAQVGALRVDYDARVEAAVADVLPYLPATHLDARGLALHYLGGAGELVDLLENGLFGGIINPWITNAVNALVPFALVRDFLVGEYGLITVALTYSFAIVLPIVGTFFLAFSLLEDSGYLPRLAVMLDRAFRSMGLNGKAVLPMILGLGCDTMATVSTRMLETRKERIQVTLLLALGVPCSAQLGVLMGMLGGLGLGAVLIWGGVVVATVMVVGYLAAQIIPGKQGDFLLELPPMRLPALRNILLKTLARMEWYLWEVVPIFIAGTALLFVLDISGALLWLEGALAPLVVNWLGLPVEATSALLVGFLRRDYGAAGLFDLSRQGLMDPVQVLVSMVVITLFVPCIANVLMIVKEQGARTAFWVVATVFPIAILVGGLLNWVIRWGA